MIFNLYVFIAVPVLLLILAELTYCRVTNKAYYSFQDSLSSLGTAVLNQCTNFFLLLLLYPFYQWIHQYFSISNFAPTIINAVLIFIATDFLFYWFHRLGHSVNFFWAAHVPHHVAESMNFAVALRASVTHSYIYCWPLALFFSPEQIIPIIALHFGLQIFSHTEVIKKCPAIIELIFTTPSHHRVHHGKNPQYLNKNFSAIFIIWDRLFGTFVAETEKATYGLKNHPGTWDPVQINLVGWKKIFSEMNRTKNPLIWLQSIHPSATSSNTAGKFISKETQASRVYLIVSFLVTLPQMFLVAYPNSGLDLTHKLIASLLVWWSVTNWAGFLENKKWSIFSEVLLMILRIIFYSWYYFYFLRT